MTDVEKFRLSLLIPDARTRAEWVIQDMVRKGFREPYVGQTLRTLGEQREAVRRGTTGRKQNLSWHLIKRAWDLRDRLPNGNPDPTTRNEPFFMALYLSCEEAGVRNLAYTRDAHGLKKLYINEGRVWDAGHCEYRAPYKSLLEAIQKEAPWILDDEPPAHDPDDVVYDEMGNADTDKVPLGLDGLPPSPFKD